MRWQVLRQFLFSAWGDEMKIGIMGGTFDPIHLGHLAMAESAREIFELDKILFMPSANPPHKVEQNITPAMHRVMMTFLATKSNENFEVSQAEILRGGISYTIDTMKDLHEKFGEETELFFIIGADSLKDLPTWHKSRELVKKCHFIAAGRPGTEINLSELENFFGEINFNRHIHRIETPGLEISSTDIRERVKAGRSIKYLVPELVEEYIFKEQLYK